MPDNSKHTPASTSASTPATESVPDMIPRRPRLERAVRWRRVGATMSGLIVVQMTGRDDFRLISEVAPLFMSNQVHYLTRIEPVFGVPGLFRQVIDAAGNIVRDSLLD